MTQNRRETDDEPTSTPRDADSERTPMHDVSHTNPYTNESMGSVFEHGVTIVADGGRRDTVDESSDAPFDDPEDDAEPESRAADEPETEPRSADEAAPGKRMKDVSHEAPAGGHGNRMFERVGDTADVSDEE